MNHVTSLFCLARYRKWLVDWLLAWLDIWLTECISRQRMIPCILTDISTCHCLTIEIRWDPGGLTDISSFCQTAYNLNTGLVIQSITTLVMKLWHVCESLHANKFSFFEMDGTWLLRIRRPRNFSIPGWARRFFSCSKSPDWPIVSIHHLVGTVVSFL